MLSHALSLTALLHTAELPLVEQVLGNAPRRVAEGLAGLEEGKVGGPSDGAGEGEVCVGGDRGGETDGGEFDWEARRWLG